VTLPRIYLPHPLAPGDLCSAPDDLTRYLDKVLRLKTGAPLVVFNGTGWEFEAVLKRTERGLAVEIGARCAVPADRIEITLCQAIPKLDRLESIIRHATELGVGRILPFVAERSVPHWPADKSTLKQARWQKITVEACRQCGRADVPEIGEVTPFAAMLGKVRPGGLNLILWEEESAFGFQSALRDPAYAGKKAFALVIGPEGGLTGEEIAQAQAAGFLSVSLGRRVLRVDTAAVAALAILQYERGAMAGPTAGGPYGG
jgi:16S rRNA (uracil1498-N3)-methyltransferase